MHYVVLYCIIFLYYNFLDVKPVRLPQCLLMATWLDISQWNTIVSNLTVWIKLFRTKQEVPLMLRGQRVRCKNIKGEPQIFESFPTPKPRSLFLLVVVFMVGLGEPQLHAKFEQILKGNPKIFGSSNSTGSRPLFLGCGILSWALANPSCVPNLKSLASVIV